MCTGCTGCTCAYRWESNAYIYDTEEWRSRTDGNREYVHYSPNIGPGVVSSVWGSVW